MESIKDFFNTTVNDRTIHWNKEKDIFYNSITGEKEEGYRLDFYCKDVFGSIYPDLVDNTWNVCYGTLKNPFNTNSIKSIEKGFKNIKDAMNSVCYKRLK